LMGDRRATFVRRTKSGKNVQRFYSPRRKVSASMSARADASKPRERIVCTL